MWDKKTLALSFYDGTVKKLLTDYLYKNPRTEAAILFFLSNLPENAQPILDIGCGIGWSSYEMCLNSSSKIIGIDLSPQLIQTAKHLFIHERLALDAVDILDETIKFEERFGLITLLDVFEHIPNQERNKFYGILNKILAEKGKVLLTCPSIYHQDYLTKTKPDGLQPVDEWIDLGVLNQLATAIKGEITFFSYKNIWHTNDYFHCAIERGLTFEPAAKKENKLYFTEDINVRKQRIKASNFVAKFPELKSNQRIAPSKYNQLKSFLKNLFLY